MATKKKKPIRLRGFITKLALGIAFAYVAISIIQLQGPIREKKQQLAVLEEKIAAEEARSAQLSELQEKGMDDDEAIRILREHGYAERDERVYKNAKNG